MYTRRYLKGTARINPLFKKSIIRGEKSSPTIVMPTPVMFNGVNSSPKTIEETMIVVTSFAIPAMDIGTTPARLMMLVCCREVTKVSC
jgi:hypothetical protein